MQYMLLIYADESAMPASDTPPVISPAYQAYTEALVQAKVLVGGDRLRPTSAATTVRVRDGRSQVLNGPYAETHEQLAGYYLLDVPSLDEALSWAARCPGAARGSVEVRPVWSM